MFARGVILVESVAEQLLLPAIAEQLDRSLAVHGVTVVNIGGVAFKPFVGLFGPDRLPYRCSVVTDADPDDALDDDLDDDLSEDAADVVVTGTPPLNNGDGIDIALSSRAARLRERVGNAGENLRICPAARTLEWDLVMAGNWELLLDALEPLRPRATTRLRRTMTESTAEERAEALVKATKKIKGKFAQSLAELISPRADEMGTARLLNPPPHLRRAIEFVTVRPSQPPIPYVQRQPGAGAAMAGPR